MAITRSNLPKEMTVGPMLKRKGPKVGGKKKAALMGALAGAAMVGGGGGPPPSGGPMAGPPPDPMAGAGAGPPQGAPPMGMKKGGMVKRKGYRSGGVALRGGGCEKR